MDNDRYEFLNDRIDHEGGRIDDLDTRVTGLEGKREVKHSRRLEWIVITLVALEALFEILMYFHPHA